MSTEPPGAFDASDARWMAHALALARRGRLTARPNPAVGCVLVRDGTVVGEGWHRRAGGPHAEVVALEAAGPRAAGAHCYVTLEPCSHHGRTGPCAQALIRAGVRSVVAAMADPNPRVAGGGLRRLAAHGVATACGLLAEAALELNRGFVSRMTRGRPWLRLKVAASVDGRTALASGESQWITSRQARRDVQWLRAASGAVMTGIGTVLADDPQLTVRAPELAHVPPPLRVVLDSRGRLPADCRLLAGGGPVVVYAAPGATWRSRPGVEWVIVPCGADGRPDLRAVLADLARREVNDVLVEAGSTLAGALLGADLVDELVLYLAPTLLGDSARAIARLPGLASLADATRWRWHDVRRVGPDLRLVLRRQAV